MQRIYLLVLLLAGLCSHIGAQCPLVCNDQINVALEESCEAYITVDMVYEGYIDPNCNYTVEIEGQSTPLITSPGEYIFRIYDASGNYCWGNILAEDKLDPMSMCQCETPYLNEVERIPDPNCVFYCYEVWDLEVLEEPGPNNIFNQVLPPIDNNIPQDNCGVSGTPSVTIDIINAANCKDKIVRRSITYTYASGHVNGSISCEQQFLFRSLDVQNGGTTSNGQWIGDFDYYCPEGLVELTCGSDISPEGIAAFFDQSSNTNIDFPETPNIEEYNEGIPYAYPYVVIGGWKGNEHAKPIYNTLCNINTAYTDIEIDACGYGCAGNKKIVRDWTVLDWCTSTVVHCEQIIKAADSQGPTITVGSVTASVDPWDCKATVSLPGPQHIHDNCDNNVTYYVIGPPGVNVEGNTAYNVPKGTHTFEYVAIDCCGNTTSTPITVHVLDSTPPVAITKERIVVNLTSSFDGTSIAKIFPIDIDNSSYDGCSDVYLEIRRDDEVDCGNIGIDGHNNNSTYNNNEGPNSLNHPNDDRDDTDDGQFVKFCCEDINPDNVDPNTGFAYGEVKVWLRVWDDGDMDGNFGTAGDNYNESWSTVRVEDKLGPQIACPPDIRINCFDDFNNYTNTGYPTLSTSCVGAEACTNDPVDVYKVKPANSSPYQGEVIPAYNQNCQFGAIERTWKCGSNTCKQWIIIDRGLFETVDIEWPRDTTIFCATTPMEEPTYVDQKCLSLGVSLESDTFYFEEGACFKVLNEWTLIDWCVYDVNNSASDGIYRHTQVVKFLDDEDPVLTVQDSCYAVTAECKNDLLQLKAFAADNGYCGSPWLKWEVEVDAYNDWTVDYTFSSFTNPNSDFYINPTEGQEGESVCVAIPANEFEGSCNVQHRVSWTVNDGCGNVTSGISYFTVEDKKKPTPYCLNLSTAIMENGNGVELWACDFDAGSFDNCTSEDNLRFTFGPIAPEEDPNYIASTRCSGKNFGCDELAIAQENGGVFPVSIYVWDECGNSDFCNVNLSLIDNSGDCGLTGTRSSVAGRIATETGETVNEVKISLSAEIPSYPLEEITVENGEFIFGSNPMYNSYMIAAEKDIDWLNGVSTLDLVRIQQHILFVDELTSPYQIIAADANGDDNVSAIDLIQIRKLILGLTLEIEGNTSWRFIPSTSQMDMDNPFTFAEYRLIDDLDTDMMSEDFIAVKVGDVNNTVVANLDDQYIDSRSSNKLPLEFQIRSVNGQNVLDFYSSYFEEIYGFQFTLETQGLEFESINAGVLDINSSMIGNFNDAITLSWNSTKAVTSSDVLFSLVLTGSIENAKLITISDRITFAEAYQGDELETIHMEIAADENKEVLAVLQNDPNPWSEFTNIMFNLPLAGNVEFTLYDLNGKILLVTDSFYDRGLNQIIVNQDDFSTQSSIFYYTISSNNESVTKKMIRIE